MTIQTATQVKAPLTTTHSTLAKNRQLAIAAPPVHGNEAPALDTQPEEKARASHSFATISIFPPEPPIQAKLTVGPANDEYEQEADRVADQVMRMTERRVQAKCACGGEAVTDGECTACKAKRLEVQRRVQLKSQEEEAVVAYKVQRTGKNQTEMIQTAPDPAKPDSSNPEDETKALIKKATDAIEKAGGQAKFHYLPADIETNACDVMFDDVDVQKFYRYLFQRWFGVTSDEKLENTEGLAVPPRWVGEFRAKALNVQPPKAEDGETKQLAELAVKLADSVAAETPAQKIRRQFVEEIDKRIGTTVMSQAAIDAERKKAAGNGYTPANFTTCIAFFGQVVGAVTQQAGIKGPLLGGPNQYREINPKAKETLPPGAWHPCTPDTRPKPGDLLIFTFAEDVKNASGGIKYGKGWFAHITILRSIQPVAVGNTPSDIETGGVGKGCQATNGSLEKWISVDGGGTTATEVIRYFCPDTCLIGGRSDKRKLHGWIDVEKVAETQLVKKPGA